MMVQHDYISSIIDINGIEGLEKVLDMPRIDYIAKLIVKAEEWEARRPSISRAAYERAIRDLEDYLYFGLRTNWDELASYPNNNPVNMIFKTCRCRILDGFRRISCPEESQISSS